MSINKECAKTPQEYNINPVACNTLVQMLGFAPSLRRESTLQISSFWQA